MTEVERLREALTAIERDMRRAVVGMHNAAMSPDHSAQEAGLVNAAAFEISRYADWLKSETAALAPVSETSGAKERPCVQCGRPVAIDVGQCPNCGLRSAAMTEPSVIGAGCGPSPMPTQAEAEAVWRRAYVDRMVERGIDRESAQACCDAGDVDLSANPSDAADDELQYWSDDDG